MCRIFMLAALFISVAAFSQNDKISLHSGKVIEGNVVRVGEFTVVFKYVSEDAEQTVSKYAVSKITYGKSGREEQVSEKIIVNSKDDWEKVVMLVDKSEAAGLTKAEEVKGKTSLINYRTAAGSKDKAEKNLKKKAAEKGCSFILLTTDKDANLGGDNGQGLGGTQTIKAGVAYRY